MTFRSATRNLAIVLCVFALFVAQTFVQRGFYICVCGGNSVVTDTSHCHGPHGANCHSQDEGGGGMHSEDESGPRKDHEVVRQDVQLRPVEAAPQLIAPQVLLGILPVQVLFASNEKTLTTIDSATFGESPPLGVTVARTIVLLI